MQWADEATVHERLDSGTTDVQTTRLMAELKFPFSVADTIEFYRLHYGPTLRAFAALSQEAQAGLRQDLESLYTRQNAATNGTTIIAAEYLEVVATRS